MTNRPGRKLSAFAWVRRRLPEPDNPSRLLFETGAAPCGTCQTRTAHTKLPASFVQNMSNRVERTFRLAKERYAYYGVGVGEALKKLARIPISLHCWQGDDVGGFEQNGDELGGGLAVTGNYPGKARTPDELRADMEKALSIIPRS